MHKITNPGFFPDMAEADYRADPCPQASITQSLVKIMLAKSPLHAWYESSMNPNRVRNEETKFDIGNIAHKLMLGRGKEIVVLEGFDNWMKKEAKEKRDEAAADGKLAVLGKHFAKADRMVKAAREQLEKVACPSLFDETGHGECVVAWREGPIWARQMIDWLSADKTVFADYKTTDMSAAPDGLGRMMVNAGWPIQAAMASRGLDAIDPDEAGRREFYFVVQETEVPYALTVVKMSEAALTMGTKQIAHAFVQWADCLNSNVFPGYPLEVHTPEYPGWHETQWLAREIAYEDRPLRGREQIPSDLLAAG